MSAQSSRATEVLLASLLVAACGRGGASAAKKAEPLRVAAAADLSAAFVEVGQAFEKQSGKKVTFSFGSTGLLAKQIEQGAPFDVFAAANAAFVDEVVERGACFGETKRPYAKGRIVIWAKDEAHLPKSIDDLRDPRFARLALANPDHAPYGKAAEQALTKAGIWSAVRPRAVFGENVQQTFMFGQTGNADVAIVALSLAIGAGGAYVPIDPALHEPLDQQMVLCKAGPGGGKPNEGRAFMDFVSSDAGRAIMKRYGFLLPGESAPGD
jgi:molybdate transport system substrate-binding protein